jgi:hypothetical protein
MLMLIYCERKTLLNNWLTDKIKLKGPAGSFHSGVSIIRSKNLALSGGGRPVVGTRREGNGRTGTGRVQTQGRPSIFGPIEFSRLYYYYITHAVCNLREREHIA